MSAEVRSGARPATDSPDIGTPSPCNAVETATVPKPNGAPHPTEAYALRPFVWATRICFTLVFLINVQCALSFIVTPGGFAAAYELTGVPGEAAVRGIGVAFLMWNCTYPPFIARPQRHMVLGGVILTQQAVGLIGETFILATLPAGHDLLAASILRFIAFDGAGLLIMAASFAALFIRIHKTVSLPR